MKKMTTQEFKKALKKADINFENWGWEGILDEIILAQQHKEQQYFKRGCNTMADKSHTRWEIIYEILKEKGYYWA